MKSTIQGTSSPPLAGNPPEPPTCYHCGLPCPSAVVVSAERTFCCHGCLTVCEILEANGLQQFYRMADAPGVQASDPSEDFRYLDADSIRTRLLDYTDGSVARVTLPIPAMHCVACVWLLEHLYRLHPAIRESRVNFPRKEVSITFRCEELPLSGLVALLHSLGYTPTLRLQDLDRPARKDSSRPLLLRLGVAGFAFGNIMLLSLAAYLGLDAATGPAFLRYFGIVSVLLSLPVLLYSASGYWRAAARAARTGVVTIDVPIAIGIAALFSQSLFEIGTSAGEGYLDSFTGLVFFLLCGAWFQRKTYDTLSFDHDYRSYFPLSVVRRTQNGDERIPVNDLAVGDRVVIRNGELLPADAILAAGRALLDFSFVTGESEPVPRQIGDYVYAGGRQVGESIELEIVKPVSQSYLTSLWNHEAFHPRPADGIQSLTDRLSRRFTWTVMAIASASAAVWCFIDPGRAVLIFSSILIVACPCALALSAPFTLGTALRVLGRNRLYLRNAETVESLARVDRVVFDKTGTLTRGGPGAIAWEGDPLTDSERRAVHALTAHSTHPHSARIHQATADKTPSPPPHTHSFREVPGAGIEAYIHPHLYRLGSMAWTQTPTLETEPTPNPNPLPDVCLAIDGAPRGRFRLDAAYRDDLPQVLQALRQHYPLALLSGDQPRDAQTLLSLLGQDATLAFNQDPHQKLAFIQHLQQNGHHVLMIGDGLNDAGALQQGDVGIALTEFVSSFTPASDGILDAFAFSRLPAILRFCRSSLRIIKASFAISICYNVIGISVAAQGLLSPVIAAILMPISSISVVVFAVAATERTARSNGFE